MAQSGPETNGYSGSFAQMHPNKTTASTRPRQNTTLSFKHIDDMSERFEPLSRQTTSHNMEEKDDQLDKQKIQKINIFLKLIRKANSWVKTSEPSSNAFKDFRKAEFQRKNVKGVQDPQAAAKLNIPQTKLPEDAILPAGKGPEPEELRLKRLAAKKDASRGSSSAGSMNSSKARSLFASFSASGSTKVASVGSDGERPLTGSTVTTNNSTSFGWKRR